MRAIAQFGRLAGQSAWQVNYAERHRAGLRVGTAITEGTANFLVNHRMDKSQQMRWSRRGKLETGRSIAVLRPAPPQPARSGK